MRKSVSCAADTVFLHPRSLAGRITRRKQQQDKVSPPTNGIIKLNQQSRPQPERPGPGHLNLGQGACVHYLPGAFRDTGPSLLKTLLDTTPWLQRAVTVHGRRVMQPRLVCYMADSQSLCYTYSGTKWDPAAWSPCVLKIKVGDCNVFRCCHPPTLGRHTGTGGGHRTYHLQQLLAQLLSRRRGPSLLAQRQRGTVWAHTNHCVCVVWQRKRFCPAL